jgi:hypothetical protein
MPVDGPGPAIEGGVDHVLAQRHDDPFEFGGLS